MARRLGAAPRGSIQQWRRLRTATVSMLLMTPTSYSFLEHLFMTISSHLILQRFTYSNSSYCNRNVANTGHRIFSRKRILGPPQGKNVVVILEIIYVATKASLYLVLF